MGYMLGSIALGNPIFLFLYFLPTLVGVLRQNTVPNRQIPVGIVFLLNLFFGWTFVGWIVALILACREEDMLSKPNDSVPINSWQSLPQIWGPQDQGPQDIQLQQLQTTEWQSTEWHPQAQEWTPPEPSPPCIRCHDQGETCPTCNGNRGRYEMPTGEHGVGMWVSCNPCCGSGRIQCRACGKTGYG